MNYRDFIHVQDGQLIYRNGKVLGDVYMEVDGYYVFWPTGVGAWEAAHLEMIAALLKDMNEDWDSRVREYFENERQKDERTASDF